MKIAIDLLWVKPKKSGGIEAYIRNLLDGFMKLSNNNEYVLILAKDNEDTFNKYLKDNRFTKIVCNIKSKNVIGRIVWQNLKLNKVLEKSKISLCFEPVYSKPIINNKNIKFITTIHDLQALHYPEYFSKIKYYWMKFSWWRAITTSVKVIAISNFVKEDILSRYKIEPQKVETIYNPVIIEDDFEDYNVIEDRYNVKKNEYYYTIAQLLPHKNLKTLINVMEEIKKRKLNLPTKLIISGVGGKSKKELIDIINNKDLNNSIIITGFIDNKERNTLYMNCRSFLFPSIFEGFGMPTIEAMMIGANVITTKKASLFEVTNGKATYVENPFDVNDWIDKLIQIKEKKKYKLNFNEYNLINVSNKYLTIFSEAEEK